MRRLVHSNRKIGVLAGLALTAPALLGGRFPAPASAESCPNEAVRSGLSANLPECRAFEMVSPVEKNGGDVDPHLTVQSAPNGEGVVYPSTTPLPGSQSAIAAGFDLARRTPTGWVAKGLEPPQLNEHSSLMLTTIEGVSEDLSKSLVISTLALAPGAVDGGTNLYLQDNETGQRTLVSYSSSITPFNFISLNVGTYFDGTPNFSHLVFGGTFTFAPGGGESVAEGGNFYESSTGQPARLLNVLPDGSEEAAGARADSEVDSGTQDPHLMSEDGSRVFFSTSAGVYMRVNGASTRLISASQRTGDDPTVPHRGNLYAASADGSVVYFSSYDQLTNVPAGFTESLYRYEVETGRLEDITPTDNWEGPRLANVEAVSKDGSYVYFMAETVLAPGAVQWAANQYVWHAGVIKTFSEPNLVAGTGPSAWSMSPDGKWFGFYGGGEIYVYSAESEHLTCVTCNSLGSGHGASGLGVQNWLISRYYGRRMLDGGKLFFQTDEALVPADSNGKQDVYEWSPQAGVSLISSGTGSQDAQLEDVSLDGNDVFFRTRQQLVGQDTDENADLYDARVDGGFPAPAKVSPCAGTGCQGVPPAPPIFATPPSVTYNGVGNFAVPSSVAAKPKAKAKKTKAKKTKTKRSKPKRGAKKSSKQPKHGKATKVSTSHKSSTRRAGR